MKHKFEIVNGVIVVFSIIFISGLRPHFLFQIAAFQLSSAMRLKEDRESIFLTSP